MKVEKVEFDQITEDDKKWLTPMPGVEKPELRVMMQRIKFGSLDLWRFRPPSIGVAVTYPDEGRLFIYYLQGYRILDTLSKEDLLDLATSQGLSGMRAETHKLGVLKLLINRGFKHIRTGETGIHVLELDDVR